MSQSEAFFQFKRLHDPGDAQLNALGREGWHIAGVVQGLSGGVDVFMQRAIIEEPALESEAPPPDPAAPDEPMVEPLCGCGCGELVRVTEAQWREADKNGLAWFAGGHFGSDVPTVGKPRRSRQPDHQPPQREGRS